MQAQNINTDELAVEDVSTQPAEDEMGYRHDDLEKGSLVVYEGEFDTVASIGRSAIRLEGKDVGIREGGIALVTEAQND